MPEESRARTCFALRALDTARLLKSKWHHEGLVSPCKLWGPRHKPGLVCMFSGNDTCLFFGSAPVAPFQVSLLFSPADADML